MLCFFGKDWHFDDSLSVGTLENGRPAEILYWRGEAGEGREGMRVYVHFPSREEEVVAWYGK